MWSCESSGSPQTVSSVVGAFGDTAIGSVPLNASTSDSSSSHLSWWGVCGGGSSLRVTFRDFVGKPGVVDGCLLIRFSNIVGTADVLRVRLDHAILRVLDDEQQHP